ncbi:CDP-glycerol glycerophosphotransferase family protein [Terrisporobacter glycolicus]|uniref:CDP-glycerol glycerophosphotransferase family protein n=1 Tax=Terrisporobacter glycolicus TaxID=36841 RepID=UPI000CDE7A35
MNINFFIKQCIKMGVQNVLLPIVYKIYSRNPVNNSLVIFADAHHKEIPYSMKLMKDKFEDTNFKVEECYADYQSNSYIKVIYEMIRFMKLYATAKYVFICDNFLPVSSCKKRKDTVVVQLWHAGGILKKFAYDTDDDIPNYYKGNVFKNYDLVTVSDECCIPIYESAMKLDKGVAKATGLSRTDSFFLDSHIQNCRKLFYKKHPDAIGKKIVLWAPTFRGKANNPFILGEDYINELGKKIGKEWYVLTKVHPHLDSKSRISNTDIPTEELLLVIDILITDYSSVIFDYILLKKPLILFIPDYDEYKQKRGFYIPLESIPGRIVKDGKELDKELLNEYNNFNVEKIRQFSNQYMSKCDGNCTERLFDMLLKEFN